MKTVDFSDDFNHALQERVLNGLAAASTFMRDAYRGVVGVNNPTYKSRKYKRKSKSAAKSHTSATTGAPAGGPPYARTHQGQLSIQAAKVSGRLAWQVGVRAIGRAGQEENYMLDLDRGINYPTHGPNKGSGPTLRWPWIEPTFDAHIDAARQQFLATSH